MNRFLSTAAIALIAGSAAYAQSSDSGSSDQMSQGSGSGSEMSQNSGSSGGASSDMGNSQTFATVEAQPGMHLASNMIGMAVYSANTGDSMSSGSSGSGSSSGSSDSASSDSGMSDSSSGSGSETASSEGSSGSSESSSPEQIGEISDLILTEDGSIDYVTIGVGGFLGIGERVVAMNYDALEFTTSDGEMMVMVSATQDEIENAQEFDPSVITDSDSSGGSQGDTLGSGTSSN